MNNEDNNNKSSIIIISLVFALVAVAFIFILLKSL